MAEIPFPGGAADQDVFFHEDKVCVYHKAINTWECRTISTGGVEAGQPAAVTTQTVYTIPLPTDNGKIKAGSPDLPDLRTQYDVNWFFAEEIESTLIVAPLPPDPSPDNHQYKFWYDTSRLELFVWYNDSWFPTAVPPADYDVEIEQFQYALNRIDALIPSAPEPGAEFTNEATGVTYRFDGQRWLAVSSIADDVIDGITDELGELTARVADGETVQSGIQVTVAEALQTQEGIQADIEALYGKTGGLEDIDHDNYLEKNKTNRVTTGFRISSDNKTFISTSNNELGLYNVVDPTNDAHAMNRGYSDGRYLKKTGGTLTGNLSFNGGSRIDANTGNSVLSGRACLELRSSADLPIAISSGSTFKPLLAFYGYDGSSPDNKEKVAEIKANGNAYFTNVYSENKKLATEEFVNERIPEAPGHIDFQCKSSVNPTYASSPSAGQITGWYEGSSGDGSKNFNMYMGNWNHSVRVNINDLRVNGDLPASGSSDYKHRGVFEMYTSNGEKLLHKAVVSSMTRSGDILTLLFEGGMNLYGTSDTSTQSSARYYFYSLV